LIFLDIETNGLLPDLSRVHCLVTFDAETGEVRRFRGDSIQADGLPYLSSKPWLAGHNILKFDLPALQKVYGWTHPGRCYDTLVAARMAFADMAEHDFSLWKHQIPPKFIGSQSLRAWGYRLGCHKGDYGIDGDEMVWAEWSREMEDYCEQDVRVTKALYDKLQGLKLSPLALWLEHEFCKIIARQERRGVWFDRQKAEWLLVDLLDKRAKAGEKLKAIFGSWKVRLPDFIPKRDNQKRGYTKGVPVERWREVIFNPASRAHIANRLTTLHGWEPKALTEGGKPKVDEAIISKLAYPEVPAILDYLLLEKRIGMLAEGDWAWLKCEKQGRIYGSVNTCGAVTGRCTHSQPNLAQVPSNDHPYGKECRALFGPTPGMRMVGCDASGLELRCLSHYMAQWDGGEYGRIVTTGDIHTANQQAAGLATRAEAKTFIYAYLYGAGDEKLGKGKKATGSKLRSQFLERIPALNTLVTKVKAVAKKRGWLRGLDGRRLRVRHQHAALNTLLQSAGALAMKAALIIADWLLEKEGLAAGKDYEFILNIHDEIQCEVMPEHVEKVGEILASAIEGAGHFFNFRCPLAGEWKAGGNWADTH
jgi:DNA polymerase I-like protein with 3'-5' exonuclease and polymerase domains